MLKCSSDPLAWPDWLQPSRFDTVPFLWPGYTSATVHSLLGTADLIRLHCSSM